jgi:hypothetical protein
MGKLYNMYIPFADPVKNLL